MGEVTFYDYDNCNYTLSRTEEEPELLKLGFNCNCFDHLIANGGKEIRPTFIKRIETHDGEVVYQAPSEQKQVIDIILDNINNYISGTYPFTVT